MDNSRSYFINKANIKRKNRQRHIRIKNLEALKEFIIREPYQSEERLETKEIINKEIERIKNKINRDTLIYSY